MKIALQITTATLGDMVIEEMDEKTTTNPVDQKAIIVELLVQALTKVTAAYKIPKDMLDLGDEYESAHTRKIDQDKEPRYSSAETNRSAHAVTHGPVEVPDTPACHGNCSCRAEEDVPISTEGTDPVEDDDLDLSDEEYEFIKGIIRVMRGKHV